MVGRYWGKEIALVLFLICCSCFGGCSKSTSNKTFNKRLVFQNGDLLFRRGNGFFSPYFAHFASKEKEFSHVGILCRNGDSIFVYHIEADELTGEGNVRKEPLNIFLKDVKHFDVRQLNLTFDDRIAVIHTIDSLYQKQVPFDIDFDLNTHNTFYCTELVAYVLNSALNKHVVVPTLIMNTKKFYSIDDLYYCKLVKMW